MGSQLLTRRFAVLAGAAAIGLAGFLTACGGEEKTEPSTSTTPTTTTTPAPSSAPAPSVSPTQNAPIPTGGNSFSPGNPAPPPVHTTHRQREYPY